MVGTVMRGWLASTGPQDLVVRGVWEQKLHARQQALHTRARFPLSQKANSVQRRNKGCRDFADDGFWIPESMVEIFQSREEREMGQVSRYTESCGNDPLCYWWFSASDSRKEAKLNKVRQMPWAYNNIRPLGIEIIRKIALILFSLDIIIIVGIHVTLFTIFLPLILF